MLVVSSRQLTSVASEPHAECLIHKGCAVAWPPRYLMAVELHGSILLRRPHTGTELQSVCMNGLVKGLSFINWLHCVIYHVT